MDMLAAINERFPVRYRVTISGDAEGSFELRSLDRLFVRERDGKLVVERQRAIPREITSCSGRQQADGQPDFRAYDEHGRRDAVAEAFMNRIDLPPQNE